ncbi:MAG TPA: hypothetical protein VM532_09560 [Burkholderiales bacterium]|nr:hypothetical protein [Burkholderiales bacterium]
MSYTTLDAPDAIRLHGGKRFVFILDTWRLQTIKNAAFHGLNDHPLFLFDQDQSIAFISIVIGSESGAQTVQLLRQATLTKCTTSLEME